MLRGDIVKADSGAYAVFTEQGSSASHVTAAKVMDVIARPLDGAGQAAGAVSAYTRVKMEGAPRVLKIPNSECSDIWIRLPRQRNLNGHTLGGLLWERQFEEVLLGLGWKKVPNLECLFVHRKTRIVLVGVRG